MFRRFPLARVARWPIVKHKRGELLASITYTKGTMQTKTETSVELIATDRVSLFNWNGTTRVQFNETSNDVLEVTNVDTEELLLAVSYFVRNLAKDSDNTERTIRILNDIAKDLKESLKTKEEAK